MCQPHGRADHAVKHHLSGKQHRPRPAGQEPPRESPGFALKLNMPHLVAQDALAPGLQARTRGHLFYRRVVDPGHGLDHHHDGGPHGIVGNGGAAAAEKAAAAAEAEAAAARVEWLLKEMAW